MADVFISYKREDRVRVQLIAHTLEAEGFSVWWDPEIPMGESYAASIRRELEAATTVLPIWSAQSVHSEWVQEEATLGKRKGALAPARIDPVDPPIGFTMNQTADLVGWSGDRTHSEWRRLIEQVAANARHPAKPIPQGYAAPKSAKRSGRGLALATVLGVALVGAGVTAFVTLRPPAAETSAAAPAGADAAPARQDGTPASITAGGAQVTFARDLTPFTTAAFTPSGRFVYAGDAEGVLRSFEAATGRAIGAHPLLQGPITALAVSPRGDTVAVGGQDGRVRLHLTASMAETATFTVSGPVRRLRFGAGGQLLAVAAGDGSVTVQDLRSNRALMSGPSGFSQLNDAALRPNATPQAGLVALGGASRELQFGAYAVNASPEGRPSYVSNADGFHVVVWTPDGGQVILGGINWGFLERYDVANSVVLNRYEGHSAPVLDLAVTRDARRFLSVSADKTLILWELDTGRKLAQVELPRPSPYVGFSPDGRFALAITTDGSAGLYPLPQ